MTYFVFKSFITRGTHVTPYIRKDQEGELLAHIGKLLFLYANPLESVSNVQRVLERGANASNLNGYDNPINLIDDISLKSEVGAFPEGKIYSGLDLSIPRDLVSRDLDNFEDGEKMLVCFSSGDIGTRMTLAMSRARGNLCYVDDVFKPEKVFIASKSEGSSFFPGRRMSKDPIKLSETVQGSFNFIKMTDYVKAQLNEFRSFFMEFEPPVESEEEKWTVTFFHN